ncbi:MAG: DNA polymerase III subunit gamma/tau, partial [Gemmatimonadota bacterium]
MRVVPCRMHRTALARKHRPRQFAELVGQDPVASTLRAAVEGGRVAHAYLFCGPGGVGKTTAARILAMALNCPDREAGEPCGRCDSCERIWSGLTGLDVVEIDAASHRGVDAARELRERAMYAPSSEQRFKVYIIDEAHMLTRDAWNALLKILEEPPPRVIFAFATTEPKKIEQSANPVLSRCQRFDFRRVSVPEIVARLQVVLEREGVPAEEGALLALARRAEGGVRDALSLLDQVLSFAGDAVRVEDVGSMLGLVEEERYLELFGLLERGDRAEVFPFVQRLLDAGFDPGEFVRGLAEALRALLLLRTDAEGTALDLPGESRERLAAVASRVAEVDLLRYLLAVSDFETSGRFRRSSQQRIQLEVLLLRLASMDSAVELEELLEAAGEGGGAPGSPAAAAPRCNPPAPAPPTPDRPVRRAPAPTSGAREA